MTSLNLPKWCISREEDFIVFIKIQEDPTITTLRFPSWGKYRKHLFKIWMTWWMNTLDIDRIYLSIYLSLYYSYSKIWTSKFGVHTPILEVVKVCWLDDKYLSKLAWMPILRLVWSKVVPALLRMIDLAIGNTHGHYILLPPSSLDDFLQALEKLQSIVLLQSLRKLNETYTHLFLKHRRILRFNSCSCLYIKHMPHSHDNMSLCGVRP